MYSTDCDAIKRATHGSQDLVVRATGANTEGSDKHSGLCRLG